MIIEILSKIFTEDFLRFVLAMTILMLGNAISGAAKGLKTGTFDWKVLLDGLRNYGLWALSAAATVAGLQIYGGNLKVTIGENELTLLQAVEYAKRVVYAYWAAKAIQNFIEFGNIETEVKPAEDVIDYNEATEEEDELEPRG